MKTTLLVMAAGMGSRFGQGIKQLTPIGPNGELIIDYSIYDAVRAGFDKVVFVIRKDLEKPFHEAIGDRISKVVDIKYAYQELDDLPIGYTLPKDRVKPWGTGHAVMAAKNIINEPFAVINADDYYGKEGFKLIHEYMTNEMDLNKEVLDLCMAGFVLKNTLSEHGGVTRGLCEVGKNNALTSVTETFEIVYDKDNKCNAKDGEGNNIVVPADSCTSMNMWGLTPAFMNELEKGFVEFLNNINDCDIKSEYLLPTYIGKLIKEGKVSVRALTSHDRWFGVTYQEDKQLAINEINKLIKDGVYPNSLY